jgi:hypothetical protein
VGLNFGVLFAWVAVSLITMPLFQLYVRRKQVREWQRSHHRMSAAHESGSEPDTVQG